jgi:ABC-type branched-subunit amino acid transport system ATPase component
VPDPVTELLSVEDLEAGYGPLQVLFGASVRVERGELVALLGTNGAGKSTLMRTIAGLMRPSAGRVRFDGADVTGWRPQPLVERGMVYIAGGRATFPSLTVLENLRMSTYPARRDRAECSARIDEALDLFPRLRERASQRAGTLSGGEQQMVAIGRALVSRPTLLMIDELSLGLAPVMLDVVQEMLATLAARGITMLIVEQSLNMAAKIAKRAYFMEKGQIRFEGSIDDLVERGDLVRAVFLGADHGQGGGGRRARPLAARR